MKLLIYTETFMKNYTKQVHDNLRNQASKILFLIILSFILMSVSVLQASKPISIQLAIITGKVTEAENDSALVGVRVQVMYSTDPDVKLAISQKDGTYSLNLPDGAKTILFSLSGYQTLMVDIAGREVINIVMSKAGEDPTLWKDPSTF
jgi:hypothetical protein